MNKIYVDVHCHLDDKRFEGKIDEVIRRAKEAGVKAIINNGINRKSNETTLSLAEKYDVVKAALGLYPLELKDMTDEQIQAELDFIMKNKDNIAAIGEVGLDYHWDTSFVSTQKKVFQQIIELSEKIRKPLMVHTRKAEKDVFEMLEGSNAKADFHAYGGNMKLAKKILDKGHFFSIPPSIVRDSHFKELVKLVPMSHLMTETDSPYLGLKRAMTNEPAFVPETIKKIAEIKQVTEEDAMNNIYMTYQRFFQ